MTPATSPRSTATAAELTQTIRLTWPDGTLCAGTMRARSAWGAFPVDYTGDTSRIAERVAAYGPNLTLQAMDDLFTVVARETGAQIERSDTGSASTPFK